MENSGRWSAAEGSWYANGVAHVPTDDLTDFSAKYSCPIQVSPFFN
jgi:hypothetical protein